MLEAGPVNWQPSLVVAGRGLTQDVRGALTDVELLRSVEQASTLTLTLHDPPDVGSHRRALLGSPLLGQRSVVTLDGLPFELVQLKKNGDSLAAVFEDGLVAQLRRRTGALAAAAGTATRTDFLARMVHEVSGAGFRGQTDELLDVGDTHGTAANLTRQQAQRGIFAAGGRGRVLLREQVSRGSDTDPYEDSWTAGSRLARDIGWRWFSDGRTVWAGSDQWLYSQHGRAQHLTERVPPLVADIDGDYDVGKPTTEVTCEVYAAGWTVPPGGPVVVDSLGPFTGQWLVKQVTRRLFLPTATVTLTRAQPDLPEPSQATAAASAQQPYDVTAGGRSARGLAMPVGGQVRGRSTTGVDIYPAAGSPVLAALTGAVTAASKPTTTFAEVHVDSGSIQVRYLHMASATVAKGDGVGAGRQVGTSGPAGDYVRIEVYQGKVRQDPADWLPGVQRAAPTAAATEQAAGAVSGQAGTAIRFAQSKIGIPYLWGGTGPQYDCSGLTQAAWAAGGVHIPRTSQAQFAGLPHVPHGQEQPGDLVFFGSTAGPHHVALYIGGGRTIEAAHTGTLIRYGAAFTGDFCGSARP